MGTTRALRRLLGLAAAIGLSLPVANAQEVGEIELIAYWDFEGSGEDAWNGHAGTLSGEARYSDGERFGMALDTSALGADTYFRIDTESAPAFFEAYNGEAGPAGRDQASYVFWQKNLAPIKNQSLFWTFSPSTGGGERGMSGHTPWGNNIIYFDTAGCCDAATQRTNQDSGLAEDDWLEWNHFAFVKNGTTKQIWVNGELLIENTNEDPLPNDNDRLFIGNGQEASSEAQPGLVDEFGIIAGAVSPEQIQELAGGASVIDIFDSSDPNFSIGKTVSLGQLPAITGPQDLSFSVKNTGDTKALNLSSITVVGGDTDNFTLTETPSTIPAESRGEVKLTFDSKNEFRQFEIMVEFTTDDPDDDDKTVVVPVRATVLNPVGPIAHYTLDESSIADAAADTTGLGNPGEYRENGGAIALGQAGLKDGSGTAAKFSGGGALTVTSLPENRLQSFTLSLWMNPTALGDPFGTVVARGQENPVFGMLESAGELVWFGEADGQAAPIFQTDGLGITPGTTYHVAMRYDHTAEMGSFWVDGVEVASAEVPPFEDIGNLFAGAFGEGALPFNGTIDDLQLYDIALTSDQVAFLIENPGKELVPVGDIDTDLDGLSDDSEVSTHNTDPLVADTDGDGLDDGAEINANTNPLVTDTDGDGFLDGFEVASGHDPLDGEIPQPDDFLTVHYDFEEGSGITVGNQGAMGGDGTIVNPDLGEWRTGSPSASGPGYLYFSEEGGGVEAMHVSTGLDAPMLGISGETDYTMMAWINVDNLSGDNIVFGQVEDDNVLHHGTRDGQYYMGHWGNDIGGGAAEIGEWHHVAFSYGSGVQTIMVDGEVVTSSAKGPLGVEAEIVIGSTRAGDDRDYAGGIDEIRVYSIPLGAEAVKVIAGLGTDSDGDGLADSLELGLFGDLTQTGDDDSDDDGLTNLQEFELGTKANVADTDGDGLKDGDETNSDPLVADTDKDGLNDSEELAVGTEPNNRDTDGDGFGDGFEISNGTDPLVADAGVGANPYDLRAAWEFNGAAAGGNVVDDTTGIVGVLQDDAVLAADAGQSGEVGDGALDLTTGTSLKVEDVEFFNDIAGNDVMTVVFWQKLDEVTSQTTFKAQSVSSSGGERGWSVHTPWSNNIIYFDTVGCCDGATQRINVESPAGLDYTDGWHHFGFVKNGSMKQIWVDGALLHEAENTSALPTDFTALWIGSAIDGAESTVGLLDDVGIFAQALDGSAFSALVSGIRPTALGSDPPPGGLAALENVGVTANGVFGLTLPNGVTADLEYSTDLVTWEVIASDVTGAVEETDAGRIAAPAGYYRGVSK